MLHSNNGVLTIIDETDRVLKQRRLATKVELFAAELEPFRATLQGVAVESTFNWYWLVDELQVKKFRAEFLGPHLRCSEFVKAIRRTAIQKLGRLCPISCSEAFLIETQQDAVSRQV